MQKDRMITGITPSGSMSLGNYLGVVKNLIEYQDQYDLFVFVANLHAITIPQDPTMLKAKTKEMTALYIACGLDPEKMTLFLQSDVVEHSQLGWILTTQSTMGELSRMTQFKDKSAKQGESENISIPTGLFTYPCLMAADILLYDPKYVPVGVDQKQHLELSRDIAIRMNNKYGEMHIVPEPILTKGNIKIMDLQDPTKKMSKSSNNPKAVIKMLDTPAEITNKIKSAITDSENLIKYDPVNKPGVSNLMNIYAIIKNFSIDDCHKRWAGKNYKDLKDDVTEALLELIIPIHEKYNEIIKGDYLKDVLENGALKAKKIAIKKVNKVQNKLGINWYRK
ncbi:tryptophan--tRNA ligase [Mesoplasma melaleucae]|uniref:Tryptophan--tRNA ligase n=1 Tax=Mesoplasma melaleucae TaxID=81459 RepID=A0A2K8NYS8_9MOLU|nr:tryptophan--tRNA ligase [Mesoplasma melaleucae]ATZ17901.1 tryptophanyl-tRNA synthetase [Mesoplasma melaleucae]